VLDKLNSLLRPLLSSQFIRKIL
jgi:hypothetical protein